VLEAVRECLQDVYDLPSLVGLMKRLDRREVSVSDIETTTPSPYARTLLFGYVAQFVYEGDSPIAERRAAALSLDQGLLAELLGRAELRELLDPDVLAEVEAELQRLTDDRKAKDVEGVADLLRLLGPLTVAEIEARSVPGTDVGECVTRLGDARRAAVVRMAHEERWAAIEDIGRLRDALGVPVPPGVPAVFTDPVDDPLGDLVARYARTHGPFTVDQLATALGLGAAVVRHTLQRLGGQGRVLDGEFRPAGTETEWCDAEVLRRLRRRSLARLRQEVEPVDPQALARFLPAWQSIADTNPSGRRGLRGVDGVLTAIDQLAGAPVPASALEQLVLAARVRDYEPAYLDELTAAGEVIWAGQGDLPGNDGWVALHLADQAPLTLPPPTPFEHSELHQSVLDALAPGGAWFFRQLSDQVRATDDRALASVLWDLVWAGRVSNDTLTPLRALIRGGKTAHRTRQAPARTRTTVSGRARMPSRGGPPETAGRWAILPALDDDPTRRAHAVAERLLDRHGVVTRGAVMSERVPGGFASVYKVLSAFEETGRCRRGNFVASLGAAQFGTSGSVDRLRTYAEVPDDAKPVAIALAATDPANPYGAALPWPGRPEGSEGHRPGRKAGAIVVLVDGALTLYVERGGKTLLTWPEDPELLEPAAQALAEAAKRGALGRMTVERADGEQVLGTGLTPLRLALTAAGFVSTPRGLRLRG
jgi:ATP-dependent Lhr-like helicase